MGTEIDYRIGSLLIVNVPGQQIVIRLISIENGPVVRVFHGTDLRTGRQYSFSASDIVSYVGEKQDTAIANIAISSHENRLELSKLKERITAVENELDGNDCDDEEDDDDDWGDDEELPDVSIAAADALEKRTAAVQAVATDGTVSEARCVSEFPEITPPRSAPSKALLWLLEQGKALCTVGVLFTAAAILISVPFFVFNVGGSLLAYANGELQCAIYPSGYDCAKHLSKKSKQLETPPAMWGGSFRGNGIKWKHGSNVDPFGCDPLDIRIGRLDDLITEAESNQAFPAWYRKLRGIDD